MKFTVTWKPAAKRELASIWINAVDRQSVTDATNKLERRLRRDPLNEGESRSGGQRITFEEPLGMVFHVNEPDLLVSVLQLWAIKKN
jgi:hypothetical protein